MARATDEAVNWLMDTSGQSYTFAITAANLIVEEELVGSGLSENRLKEIEQFLAAHFATLAKKEGGLVRTSAGESAETYRTVHAKNQGFTSTNFGQQALALDTTGRLVALGSGGLKAQFRVMNYEG